MLEPIQNALLALAFLACGGLHIVLRLLSLHLCNEYPSLPTKKKKKKAACHQTFTGIYHAIKAKVCHWSARGLSFLGRVHVAKQVLAASLWYHATFQRPSEQLLNQISSQLRNYVATTQHSSHSDAGMALAQGNSQNPAQPLSQAPTASLYPGQITSSLLPARGGGGGGAYAHTDAGTSG